MTERERLIEHIREGYRIAAWHHYNTAEATADHLLANGVIVPPCKVGDTVWYAWKDGAHPHTIKRIVIDEYGTYADTGSVFFPFDYFGKCVFLTEEALKARDNK